ncbi:patatin-domain-containing protein, partial [Martensiomyces pterosporus]
GFPADFLNMFMKSISIFGYIEEPVFHEFSRQLQTRRLLAGERMFENDEDRDDQNFYVVIEGQVQIYLADGSSAEPEAHSPHAELYSQRQHGTIPADAILLNVIGPGDVLSSLFSILSLFTEGVPLRQGEQPSAAASAAFRGAKSSDQQEQQRQQQWPPAEYTPDGNQQQSIHHVAESIGTRASQQTPPPLAQGLYAGPLNIHAHPDTVSAGASDAPPLPASAFAHARGGRRSTKPARPNVVARATADTTLAMIPANAFQRVTRLYPKAAAHILQVILTRLQRVTFATLYGYLDVPNELVAVERAINELAKCPLKDELQLRSSTLQSVRDIFSRHAADPASRVAPHSPTLSGGGSSLHVPKSSITSDPTANYARHFSTSSTLQPSWKVTHQRLVALSMQTDTVPSSSVPAAEAIESLRKAVLHQLCASIGLNAYSVDGRYSSPSLDRPQRSQALPSAAATPGYNPSAPSSRRSSTNRKLPRTEHLLPVLQNLSLPSQKRSSASTPPLPLAEIPSLVNELELYHLPDSFALIEQGQRPDGLYIVLDGKVEITPRGSVAELGGTGKKASMGGDGASEPTIVSYTARAGELVGYLPALTDMTSLYTARSKGPVLVGFISRWALDRICERYPIILMTLARRLTSQLPPAILNIDYALEWVQVKASEMVYRRGETSDAVYVVLTGRLRAFVEKDNGSISILAEYGQGQSVGEPNLLLNEPCKFNLHAIRDTELVRIPTALFKALMQTAPGLTFHLSRTLAVRTAQSLQQQQLVEQQLSRHSNEGYSRLRGMAGAASIESGIRSHNKNLKSIAIIPVNSEVPVRAFAQQLEEALTTVAGSVALLDHTTASRVLGRHAFSRIARLKIVSWIAELEQRCRLLLHVADGGISSPWTRHCVRHSDFILLVGLGDGDPSVGEFERLLLALKTTARKELVLLHENRTCATGSTRKWLKQRPWVHAHHHMQMPLDYDEFGLALTHGGISKIKTSIEKYYNRLRRSKQFTPASYQGHRSDFARLARYLCGKSVGVVLSGGGARGIALLGVLRAFEEAGIPVDMVGGTSIGAFMSGLYAQHPDSVAIHGPVKAFSRRMSSMWRFLLDITYPILSYTSGREFNRAIWKVFKESEIEDLWLPFYCMTANITQSRSEVHTTGLLWRVVRASMSLSGFVPPLCDENGDMLVDGGYLDNLPVRVMKSELGADMIFAVDIAGENDTSPVRYGASVSGIWVLLNHLNPLRSYWIPTLSEVQSRLTYASSDKELESAKVADSCVYLRVPPRDVGVLDFGRFDELYKRGYEYAKEWTARW